MSTKKEYADVLNDIFGLDIGFEKLTKEDLIALATVLSRKDFYINHLKDGKGAKEKIIDEIAEVAKDWDGPVLRRIKSIVGNDKDK